MLGYTLARKSRKGALSGMAYARIGKPVVIPGKGGLEHKYWQHVIREHCQKQGCYAVIEQSFDDKNVDVGVEKDGQRTAVEIELTDANLLANVEKDTPACNKVIICAKSQDKPKEYAKRLEQEFDTTRH